MEYTYERRADERSASGGLLIVATGRGWRVNALVDRRRRDVLDCLREHGRSMALSDVAEALAARRYGSDATEADRRRVYVSLRSLHVPSLVDRGDVEYSPSRDAVSLPADAD